MKKLLNSIKQDKKINSTRSFIVLLFYRVMNRCYIKKHIGIRLVLLSIVKELVFFLLRIDSQISYKATIGDNIRLLHSGMGVVISSKAIIKNNQTIYHQVTIGINENLPEEQQRIIINENCYMSVGCKIISSEIGKNSKIGAGSIVLKDVPANSTIVGIYK